MITIKELASELGVSVGTIHRYINTRNMRDSLTKEGNAFVLPANIEQDIRGYYATKANPKNDELESLKNELESLKALNKELTNTNAILLDDINEARNDKRKLEERNSKLEERNENLLEQIETNRQAYLTLSHTLEGLSAVQVAKQLKEPPKEENLIQGQNQEENKKKPWYKRIFR